MTFVLLVEKTGSERNAEKGQSSSDHEDYDCQKRRRTSGKRATLMRLTASFRRYVMGRLTLFVSHTICSIQV